MSGMESGRLAPIPTPAKTSPVPQILQKGSIVQDTVALALDIVAKHARETAYTVCISSDLEQSSLTELELSSRFLLRDG